MENFYIINDLEIDIYIKRIENLVLDSKYKEQCMENILYLIKLCKVFAQTNYESKNIIAFKCNNFLRLNIDKKIYFSTDHHGDMAALLHSLLKSGVAKYKNSEIPIIYFDMESGSILNEKISNISNEKLLNIIPIPDLIVNKDFKDQLILNGDIIDRGAQSDSCFCLLYYLLNQEECDNKIIYLFGNHENMMLNKEQSSIYDTPLIIENSYTKKYNDVEFEINIRNTKNYDLFNNLINNLILQDKLKLCININDVIFSHTFFEKNYIMKCIENYSEENHDLIYGNFNLSKIYDLYNKIEKGIELNITNIELLTEFVNVCFKVYCTSNAKDKYELFEDNNGNNGLLWSRNYDNYISGVKQVVGHNITQSACDGYINKRYYYSKEDSDVFGPYNEIDNFKPEFIKKPGTKQISIIKSDVMQSSGYRIDNTNATLFYFNFDGKDNYLEVENELIFKNNIEYI